MVDLPHLPPSRFVVGELLGEGGMARVYRAWHVESGRWCAVKVLREGVKPKARKRFLTEGELMCRLSHRNLLHGWELDDANPPYLVMDIAEGGSLKDWVDRYGAMAPRLAVDVAIQICKGVATAHRARVTHRDIKPHNVLIARKGVCKLTDFGIARVRPELADEDPSAGGDALGTLGYMAPEQQSDPGSADARCDVYGIGATLFHLLKGQTPPSNLFAAAEYPETFDGVPDPLLPILRKAVSYRAEDRQQSVSELAKALHDTWESLPPPPPDAPTLMTGMPPELPPPPGMASRATPVSVATRLDLGKERPSLEDHTTPTSVSLPSRTDPSDFRRALVQSSTRHEEEPERTRWWFAVPVVLAALFGLWLLDFSWVASAQGNTDAAVHDFLALARRDLAVVDDLGQLGADADALMAGYDAIRTANGLVARASATDAWLASLASAAAAAAGNPDQRTRAVVSRRIEELTEARELWRQDEAVWRHRASSLVGRLVVLTGTVAVPPAPDTGAGGR